MMTIIAATAIALSLACIVLMKARPTDPAQLTQPRAALLTMGVQIVCGNCSGEDWRPIRTYLDRFGNCAQCGGRSYLLASALAANIMNSRISRSRDARQAISPARVIPFELPGSRSDRIAV